MNLAIFFASHKQHDIRFCMLTYIYINKCFIHYICTHIQVKKKRSKLRLHFSFDFFYIPINMQVEIAHNYAYQYTNIGGGVVHYFNIQHTHTYIYEYSSHHRRVVNLMSWKQDTIIIMCALWPTHMTWCWALGRHYARARSCTHWTALGFELRIHILTLHMCV